MEQNFEEAGDPTQRRYNLTCKTKFFETNVSEKIKGTNHQYHRKLVLLVPQESDQRTAFLRAWLPEQVDEYFEIAAFLKAPIDSPCRVAIFRGPDKRSEKHYLIVMSKGVEDILVNRPEGTVIHVQTFAAAEDSETDGAIDSNGSFDLIDGHTDIRA